ncbi:hypothetical protein BZG36_05628, partial [Bifiguratus adelaidae]
MTVFTNRNLAFAKAPGRAVSDRQSASIKTESEQQPAPEAFTKVYKEDKYSTSNPHNPQTSVDDYTSEFLEFMNSNPTVYHACSAVAKELESHGFVYLSERVPWEQLIGTSNKFYTTRNGSSLVAFVIGANWKPGNGVGIIGSHIDALTGKIKPISKKDPVDGYLQIGAAAYSGAFNNTWWDRDLGIGGRVIVREGAAVKSKLVHIPYPVARIPTLAPHFGAPAQGPFNPETQMTPIIGLVGEEYGDDVATEEEKQSPLASKHSIRLLRVISKYLGVPVKDFLQCDLEIFDTHKGTVGGLDKEFVFCPRIDDKLCSFAAIHGLIESLDKSSNSGTINIVALYDDEEIGSLTRQGAIGNLFEGSIDRIFALYGGADDEMKRLTYANSFFISADVTHAVNPNFSNIYLDNHKPKLNTGLVIDFDPNGHTTTDAVSAALIEEIARKTGNVVQYFQIRNDSRSGGTIGPHIASKSGIRSIDCSIPQLSMHSIRATTGSKDVWLGVKFFKNFFEEWEEVDFQFKLGDFGSRSVIYSGLHTHENGQYGLQHREHHFMTFDHIETAPKLLGDLGYLTGIIGKVHVGPASVYPWTVRDESDTRDVTWVAERAEAFFAKAKEADKPFYLTVGYMDPHRDSTRSGFANDANYRDVQDMIYDPAKLVVPPFLSDLPEVRLELAEYYRSINRMDQGVGKILTALDKAGLADETLVVFVSDNGSPFLNSKTTLYDAGVRLPLIVRRPGGEPGVINPNLVSFIDILPTFLDWAGHGDLKGNRLGRSFLPLLEEKEEVPDWDKVFGSHTFHEITNYYPTRFLRTQRYKYHRNVAWKLDFPFSVDLYGSLSWEAMRNIEPVMIGSRPLKSYVQRPPEELYDLEVDPREVNNLASDPAHTALLLKFRKILEEWQRQTKDPWLYRDGMSVTGIQAHLDAGLKVPDRFDFDISNP